MSLWTKSDAAAGAPKFPGTSVGISAGANGSTMFGNTQIGAFQTDGNHKLAVGIFGVDTTEQTVSSSSNTHSAHAGWVQVIQGTGPIVSISANSNSYSPNSKSPNANVYLTFSGGGVGTTAANAQIIANATTGLITSIQVNSGGNYLRAPVIGSVPNSNAVLTITMGGRAGRVQTETLVAMGTIGTAGTSDASDDATFADS